MWCAVLCCTVLCCAVLCCALRCAALCSAAVLHCAELCCADLCCAMLCWAALRLLPPSSFPPSSSPSSFNFQCMHCSAAVWYFSLLTAAALGASASAVLVVPCWKFWSLAVACFNKWGGRSERASEARERSSLTLPLGFHGPLCMHCSAAVWCFSLLAAAALGASAAAGLVAPCWKFWSLAVACFNYFQVDYFLDLLNKEISLLRIRWRGK